MEKTLSHNLIPNNQTNLLSWDEIFEVIDFYYTDDYHFQNLFHVATREATLRILNQKQTKAPKEIVTSYVLTSVDQCGNESIAQRMNARFDDLGIADIKQQKINTNHKPEIALYYSFFPFASSHDIHCDNTDVYHWQQKGYSQWDVFDNGKHTYVLSPGDAIFIPMGMYHRITPLTARAGLSLGFFPDDIIDRELPVDYFKRKELVFPYDQPPFNDEIANSINHWYNE